MRSDSEGAETIPHVRAAAGCLISQALILLGLGLTVWCAIRFCGFFGGPYWAKAQRSLKTIEEMIEGEHLAAPGMADTHSRELAVAFYASLASMAVLISLGILFAGARIANWHMSGWRSLLWLMRHRGR